MKQCTIGVPAKIQTIKTNLAGCKVNQVYCSFSSLISTIVSAQSVVSLLVNAQDLLDTSLLSGPNHFTSLLLAKKNLLMSTGQTVTIAFLVTQGSTAYYENVFQIDGTNVTPKWQGGTAPSAGNASSVDVYTYTITKTASATYTVLASQTKFA